MTCRQEMLQQGIGVYHRQSCRSTTYSIVEEIQDESGTHPELPGILIQSLLIKELRITLNKRYTENSYLFLLLNYLLAEAVSFSIRSSPSSPLACTG